jgi:hypothetical protein
MKNNQIKFNTKDPIREIEGFPKYFISANGIVYSNMQSNKAFYNGGLYPILPKEHNRGYWEVGLFTTDDNDNKIRKWIRVHRLVADAFIPKPLPTFKENGEENILEVNHRNGNKKDNRVENLEWLTRSENVTHTYVVLGREAVTRPIYYDKVKYNSIKECAIVNGFSHRSLCATLSQGKKVYKGKPLRYAGNKLVHNKTKK